LKYPELHVVIALAEQALTFDGHPLQFPEAK